MCKLPLLSVASVALVLVALFCSPSARADSLSCASVNGVTRCTGSGGLDCRTVEGRMVCTPGAKGSCETVGDRIICRNGGVTQTLRTGPLQPPKPDKPDERRSQPPGALGLDDLDED